MPTKDLFRPTNALRSPPSRDEGRGLVGTAATPGAFALAIGGHDLHLLFRA